MSAKTIQIDQANQSVTFPETTVIDELVVELFDRSASDERHELYDRVLRAGSYAYLEDRIGSFLATTATTIGAEFQYLKMLFDARQHSMATAEKGEIGEDSVLTELTVLADRRGWADEISGTGGVGGTLDGGANKTGDVVAHIGGTDGPCLAIEVKFDTKTAIGDTADAKHEKNRTDTAWSQLVESAANRDADIAMIVFDQSSASASVRKNVPDIEWLPGGGLAVMVDVGNGDFRNLIVAYTFARAILLEDSRSRLDAGLLSVVAARVLTEVKRCLQVRRHVEAIVRSARDLLGELEQSDAALESIQEMLTAVDADHPLGSTELITLHKGEDVRTAIARVGEELADLDGSA